MNSDAIILFGASAILIYSMKSLSDAVRYAFGSRFRGWINNYSANDYSALGLGFLLSLFLNSGTALTIMLAGLATAGVLNQRQIMAIILGGAIGRTLLIQLITFNISEFALLFIGLSIVAMYASQKKRNKQIASIFLHLGMMFFAMTLIRDAGIGLQSNELFVFLINYFENRPLISCLMAVGLTALTSSSAATIAFVMSFMEANQLGVAVAIPWVIGANLGTSITAYLATMGGGIKGRQVAVSGLLIKVVGSVVCFAVLPYFAQLVEVLSDDLARQIAHANTMFNLFMVLTFFPFIGFGVKFIYWLLPTKSEKTPFRYKYLDKRCLEAPELAMAQAQREILRLSDTVERMVSRSLNLFKNWDRDEYEKVRELDKLADYLNKGIKTYLTQLPHVSMEPVQVEREFELLLRTNDLESIGDIVDKNILAQAKKMNKKSYSFTDEGWDELCEYHRKVVEVLQVSTAFFNSNDKKLGIKLMILDEEIEDLNLELSEKHVKRLHAARKESHETSSIHLDLLGYFHRICSLSINFAMQRGLKSDQQSQS